MKAAPIEKIIGDKCPSSGAAYRIPLSKGIKINSTNVAQAPSKTLDSANVAFMAAGAEIVGVADEPVGSGPAGADAGGADAILTMVKDKRLMIQEDGDSLIF
jgi:hypothetical protein